MPLDDSPAPDHDDRPEAISLLANIRAALPSLEALLAECSSHWGYEDRIYRFYHQSFKVYSLQATTMRIVDALRALAPERKFNERFLQILSDGTGRAFGRGSNERWLEETRPIVEAFFHARYMLEMAVKYGRELERPPQLFPSGWAALLYLYNLR